MQLAIKCICVLILYNFTMWCNMSLCLQSDDASGAGVGAAVAGVGGAKAEAARGNGPLSAGGGLMEEMSALLARR